MHVKWNSIHLFNDYIKVSDNQESVLKIINATKLLNEEISKVGSKSERTLKFIMYLMIKSI